MNQASTRAYDRSIALYDEACAVLAGGVNSNFRMGMQPAPLFFERAEGARLYDVDGNAYVDYVLGMGPIILGHAPESVLRAVAETLAAGQIYAGQHRGEVELGRRFQQVVPCSELVRFGSSGSEMDQAALRVARAATGRPKVVKFEGHYHGWFDTILVSVAPPLDQAGPAEAPIPHLPSAGQSAAAAADVVVLPWNDLEVVRRYLDAHWRETAGLLMEPILCNTSVIVPRDGYLEGVRKLCDRYGVALIFDEVITGFRVGLGGAQARLGVTPDLAVFAKAFGAGFTIAALAGRRDYMRVLADGSALHGGTFNANVVSTAASNAALEELARDDGAVYRQIEERGEALMQGIWEIGERAGLPLHVQGVGAAFNTSFTDQDAVTDYRSYQRTDLARQRRLVQALQERGVRVTSRGTWFLSAAHGAAEVEETLAAVEAAVAEL